VAYQWPSELVDNFQQGSAALARGLCPTAQFGYAGSTFAGSCTFCAQGCTT
jgi:hypothetical protein